MMGISLTAPGSSNVPESMILCLVDLSKLKSNKARRGDPWSSRSWKKLNIFWPSLDLREAQMVNCLGRLATRSSETTAMSFFRPLPYETEPSPKVSMTFTAAVGCQNNREPRKKRKHDTLGKLDISWNGLDLYNPILDTRISVRPPFVTLRSPPLDSEMGWTGELWSKTYLLNCQN